MKERKILPLVLSMSLPMVISMAVNALYNIVDSYFVAKLSEEAMTALALVYPIQNLITAIGVGIGIGINAGIAYYLGAKKQTTANQIATQGIALSVLHGILLTVLCTAGLWKFLKGFSADLEVNLMAITYGNRVLLFSVVITLGITFEKIFQSVGKMKVSMFSMICGCLINKLTELLKPYQNTETPDTGDKTPETQPSESNQTPETQPSNTTPSTDKTSSLAKQTVKLKAFGKGKLKVSWKKDKNASGYEITYSTKKSFKNKKTVVVKSKKTTSKVIKKLKSKKTYYVKVRSYKKSGKTKVYGSYSKVKSLRSK